MSEAPRPAPSPHGTAPAEAPVRIIARLIDGVALAGFNGLVLTPLVVAWLADDAEFGIMGLLTARTGLAGWIAGAVAAITGLAYFAGAEARWGRTLGKAMTGLEVQETAGGAPDVRDTLVRNGWVALGVIPTVVGDVLGLLAIVTVIATVTRSAERRGWHDRLAGTIVVRHTA